VVTKLLDAHANGHVWTEDAASEKIKRLRRTFRRDGVTATWDWGQVTIKLDEYSVFATDERKRLATEQAEAIGANLKK
jgi:hypothetical protein